MCSDKWPLVILLLMHINNRRSSIIIPVPSHPAVFRVQATTRELSTLWSDEIAVAGTWSEVFHWYCETWSWKPQLVFFIPWQVNNLFGDSRWRSYFPPLTSFYSYHHQFFFHVTHPVYVPELCLMHVPVPWRHHGLVWLWSFCFISTSVPCPFCPFDWVPEQEPAVRLEMLAPYSMSAQHISHCCAASLKPSFTQVWKK